MPIIEVQNVIKEFQLGQLKNIKNSLVNTLNRVQGKPVIKQKPFRALDDISFSIEPGEVVGVVGTNGAGKSTLLKLLSRIITPTYGTVKVHGTVAPLIEVGAGLHPDLTGRENIYLNGAIMGIPAVELRRKFDEIVEFAELENFIDTPIKRYSTGMAVRLGFSIATSVDADILIVDEVLAVGDLAFQRKCFDRMEELIKRKDKTVLLVSHNIRQVERICTRGILLDHGKVVLNGDSKTVCNQFYNQSNEKIFKNVAESQKRLGKIVSSGEIEVKEIAIRNGKDSEPTDSVEFHGPMRIGVTFEAFTDIDSPEILVGIHTSDFVYVTVSSSLSLKNDLYFKKGTHYIECVIDKVQIKPGSYSIMISFHDKYHRKIWHGENLKMFKISANGVDMTFIPIIGLMDIPVNWNLSQGVANNDRTLF